MLKDQLNRPLRDLRISVTDRCNLRCRYCMPSEIFGPDYPFLDRSELLSFEEIERLAGIFAEMGVQKLRLTGGEPLLRKDLPVLIRKLSGIRGIEDIALTTNGVLLPRHAQDLREAGLKRVTVSLDSLDETRFGELNGRGVRPQEVLNGIEAARAAGLGVKINMVVQKGVNDQDILQMARFFKEKSLTLRFIEFMDVGNSNDWKMDSVVSKAEILNLIQQELPFEAVAPQYPGEVAKRFRYLDGAGEFGIISSVTDAFCQSCSRARLSADGKLYTCLFATQGTDVISLLRGGQSDAEIAEAMIRVWNARDDRYSEDRASKSKQRSKQKIEMSYIGG